MLLLSDIINYMEKLNKLKNFYNKYVGINLKELIFLIIFVCFCFYDTGYMIYKPGGIVNVDTRITGNNLYESSGTFNMAYVKFNNLTKKQQLDLQAKMLENADVLNMTFVQDSIDQANDMLQTLNKVVVILIVLAAMLSFIVLYNLSNINIQERKREIATLKVLGFYPKEVNRYITQENWILTFFGVLIGLVAGFFLTNIVVSTVEIEYVRFIHIIKPLSFLYSSIMSFVFTFIINFITHFSLKKIDMIESLKSVE